MAENTKEVSPQHAPSPSSPAAVKIDNAIRQYLASINMAPILEEFVAETVAERPDDVYAFMESFAKRKRAEKALENEWTFARSWCENAGRNDESLAAFAASFFNVLFITQRTMRHTVFATVAGDLPAKGLALAKVLDRLVRGAISDIELAALVASSNAADLPIEPYHYQSIVSALLLAIRQSMTEAAWDATSEEWRSFCMSSSVRVEKAVSDAKTAARMSLLTAQGTENNDEDEEEQEERKKAKRKSLDRSGEVGPTSSAVTNPNTNDKEGHEEDAPITAKQLWDKMPAAHQKSIVRGAFDVLFTQHAPMRRTFFAGVDIESLTASLHPLLEQLINDTLTDEAIVGTGVVARAVELGAQTYHVQYGVTALLMSVSMALGRAQWEDGEVAEVWRAKVFALGERVTALIEAEREVAEQKKKREAENNNNSDKNEDDERAEKNLASKGDAAEAEVSAKPSSAVNEEEL